VPAAVVVLALAMSAVLLGLAYFRRYRITRPPLGVMTLGDVVVMLGAIILIPYLYLRLPGWLVAGLLALGALGLLHVLFEPVVRPPWIAWLLAATIVATDIILARQMGTASLAYLAGNDIVLVLLAVAVANVWAQSGMRARDLALLGAGLAIYDVVTTALLPLTGELMARLAGLPLTPVVAWPTGGGGWLGLGLGDLLLATAGPLVFRKAFGRMAGWVAVVIALAAIALPMLLVLSGRYAGAFPVMVLLGPAMVAHYLYWIRVNGRERTTAESEVEESRSRGVEE
jgi:hypothetical protein